MVAVAEADGPVGRKGGLDSELVVVPVVVPVPVEVLAVM